MLFMFFLIFVAFIGNLIKAPFHSGSSLSPSSLYVPHSLFQVIQPATRLTIQPCTFLEPPPVTHRSLALPQLSRRSRFSFFPGPQPDNLLRDPFYEVTLPHPPTIQPFNLSFRTDSGPFPCPFRNTSHSFSNYVAVNLGE